ncbi:MAG: hypothetical protein JNG86_08125 [Verrucomicrobiaceae bacterium]|nr:hypothetical protein [Verrucomicrobiaceae bacterium]
MKRVHITWVCSALVACALSFALGMQFQKMRGYHYELRSEKRVPYSGGTVAIKYVTETMGLPFLDPGTSIVTLERESGSETTIFKARRVFQEASPFVSDVKVNGDAFEWNDGERQYKLRISSLEREESSK